jgi:hypothetical protein
MQELRDNVLGNTTSIPRKKAIAMLLSSDFEDKYLDFKLLLENENEPSIIRYIAAISLGKMNRSEAREVLLKNIWTRDELVLTGIFMALGRCGNESSLDAILQVKDQTSGFAASQGEFAAVLISYRLGLHGNELQTPAENDYSVVPDNAQSIDISKAEYKEIKLCLKSLSEEPYGIEFATDLAYQIHYDRGIGMVLFNQSFIMQRNLRILLEKKVLLGIFADKFEETGTYSIAYLIFTWPDEQDSSINILVTRPDGRRVFGGKAIIEANNAKFKIRSISQIGVFPLLLEGSIQDNSLEITSARFSTIIQNKNQPLESQ